MPKALTQLAIDNLKPGAVRREVPDGKERGLYLVVQPTGSKAWAFRYRDHGQPRKLTIGAYPAIGLAKARAEAARAKVSLADGDDPAAAKRASRAARRAVKSQDDSVERVTEDFINLYARPNTRNWRETARLLAEFSSAWKGRRLADIGKPDIACAGIGRLGVARLAHARQMPHNIKGILSKRGKLFARVQNNPKDVGFDDACHVAEMIGFAAKGGKGAHRAYLRPGEPRGLNFQRQRNGTILEYQAKQLIAMLQKYGSE